MWWAIAIYLLIGVVFQFVILRPIWGKPPSLADRAWAVGLWPFILLMMVL